ncbi:hypothetical protein Hanom_Chr04g00363271 [Helianthus anomalus]
MDTGQQPLPKVEFYNQGLIFENYSSRWVGFINYKKMNDDPDYYLCRSFWFGLVYKYNNFTVEIDKFKVFNLEEYKSIFFNFIL